MFYGNSIPAISIEEIKNSYNTLCIEQENFYKIIESVNVLTENNILLEFNVLSIFKSIGKLIKAFVKWVKGVIRGLKNKFSKANNDKVLKQVKETLDNDPGPKSEETVSSEEDKEEKGEEKPKEDKPKEEKEKKVTRAYQKYKDSLNPDLTSKYYKLLKTNDSFEQDMLKYAKESKQLLKDAKDFVFKVYCYIYRKSNLTLSDVESLTFDTDKIDSLIEPYSKIKLNESLFKNKKYYKTIKSNSKDEIWTTFGATNSISYKFLDVMYYAEKLGDMFLDDDNLSVNPEEFKKEDIEKANVKLKEVADTISKLKEFYEVSLKLSKLLNEANRYNAKQFGTASGEDDK